MILATSDQIRQRDDNVLANRRQAERMLEMLSPSIDPPWLPHTLPEDERPRVHSVHTFVVRKESEDTPLPIDVKLAGTLLDHFATLERLNRTLRTGIFVEVDASTHIVAELTVAHELRTPLPCEPSLSIHVGAGRHQFVYMLDGPLPPKTRDMVAERLASYGADVTTKGLVLLRVAGFFTRYGRPIQVSADGLRETIGQRTIRYSVAQMLEGFGLAQETAAA